MPRASAMRPMQIPPPLAPPMPAVAPPHGMSLLAKPMRPPHPTHVGRDIFGRMMPGQLMANAAPPFKAAKIAPPKPVAMTKPPRPAPIMRPAPPMPTKLY